MDFFIAVGLRTEHERAVCFVGKFVESTRKLHLCMRLFTPGPAQEVV